MSLPEGEKCLFACAVHTGDTIQIDLNSAWGWATLADCSW